MTVPQQSQYPTHSALLDSSVEVLFPVEPILAKDTLSKDQPLFEGMITHVVAFLTYVLLVCVPRTLLPPAKSSSNRHTTDRMMPSDK